MVSVEYKIELTQNKYTLVDADVYELIYKFNWCASKQGNKFYALRSENYKNLFLHRYIMNPPKGLMVDHINGDTLDNRRCNLRICTNAENQRNQKLKTLNTSGYKGVCWHKIRKKWMSNIKFNNKTIYLGYFDNIIDAAIAYDTAAVKYFGEFANINFKNISK